MSAQNSCLWCAAYVNGQRQGGITERSFSIGDCIAWEKFISEVPPCFLPTFDIEDEIKSGFKLQGKYWRQLTSSKDEGDGSREVLVVLMFHMTHNVSFFFHKTHRKLQPPI